MVYILRKVLGILKYMIASLPADFFHRNRQAVRRESEQTLPVVVPANGLLQRTADTSLPFAQDSNFWYLTGIDVPDAIVVITEAEEFLIVPGRSDTRVAFDGAVDFDALRTRSGIATIYDESEGWRKLEAAVKRCGMFTAPLAPSAYISTYGMHANPGRKRTLSKIHRLTPGAVAHDIRPVLAKLRSRKQPDELHCMRAAIALTKTTLTSLEESLDFAAMRHEYQVEAAITQAFRAAGASGHAYAPIVAAGHNATTLHYVANNSPVAATDFIVVDVGAEIEHYAADITRTLHQGTPSPRQTVVYEAVQAAQAVLLDQMKPGAMMQDIESSAEKIIGRALKALGLISDPKDTSAIRRYYPHSSSHFLGLDVHDVGDYRAPLEPGMVLTCEPGVYIPEEGIGVRIEDDVLITETGHEVL